MTTIQVAEAQVADEQLIEHEAAQMYNELVNCGEDPVRAAHLVDLHFGFIDSEYPRFECWLCRRDCRTAWPACEHWRYDAEGAAVQ